MAYLKLNTSRAWEVIKDDSVNIPNISSGSLTGAATATTANKLVDATSNQFTVSSVQIGDIVVNTTDGTKATVTAIDSSSTLSISANIFATAEAYEIYKGNQAGAIIYTGTGGTIRVLTAGGDDVSFASVQPGEVLPIQVVRVFSTGTGATGVVAMW
jgi:hypothetical protein